MKNTVKGQTAKPATKPAKMPSKRSLDISPADTNLSSAMGSYDKAPPVKAQKTERSHEENQERAYIAASRRADRSLEARVQSARMASEIHRKRTGRSLKVTEEIVVKEEMYEEEEDDIPRFMHLGPHLQTGSSALNHRASAYMSTQAAMATLARHQEVHRNFAQIFGRSQSFPQNVDQTPSYLQPLMTNNTATTTNPSPTSPAGVSSPANPTRPSISQSRNGSTIQSPPALTPSSASVASPEARELPYPAPATSSHQFETGPEQTQQSSFFTSELSNNVKQLANADTNDSLALPFFGGNISNWQMPNQPFGDDTYDLKKPAQYGTESDLSPTQCNADNDMFNLFADGASPTGQDFYDETLYTPIESNGSVDFPPCINDEWDSFLNFE